MDQKTFLSDLEKHLEARHIDEIESIIDEYREHFRFKIADGYTDEEIAARLGAPLDIASQYTAPETSRPVGHRGLVALVSTGLSLLFLVALPVIVLFFSWVIVLGATSLAGLVAGVSLISGLDPAGLMPSMPAAGAVVMGLTCLGLALLAGTGTVYCLRFALQWVKAYFHWNRRCLAVAAGRPASPPIAATPQFSPRARRLMRRLTGLSLAFFGTGFVLSYIILALSAGALEFWHVWGWFLS